MQENAVPLLSRLVAVQRQDGFISEDAMKDLSKETGIPITRIYETATFYSFLSVKKEGKHVIRVCDSPSCYLNGSGEMLGMLRDVLGIGEGETTGDGLFTVRKTSCLGCCNHPPAAMIDDKVYQDLTKDRLRELLDRCR